MKKYFQRLKTSSASGLSFDLTQNQVLGPTQSSKTLPLNFLWIYFLIYLVKYQILHL